MGVETGGHEDDLRTEGAGERREHPIENQGIIAVRTSFRQGNVDGESLGLVPADLRQMARSRKERTLMNGEEQHPRIGFEQMLGAVSVMNVPINDKDPLEAEAVQGMICSKSRVVEHAVAHRSTEFGMMARRADQGETAATGALQNDFDSGLSGSGGQKGRFISGCGGESVRGEGGSFPVGALLYETDVCRAVQAFKCRRFDETAGFDGDALAQGIKGLFDGLHPLGVLRMIVARIVVAEPQIVEYDKLVHEKAVFVSGNDGLGKSPINGTPATSREGMIFCNLIRKQEGSVHSSRSGG